MATKITDLFLKVCLIEKMCSVFMGCWIYRSPTVGFVNFPCSQTSDPVSFLDDKDRFWGWWYIPNCQMLNKLPRSSSFVVSIWHFQGYRLSRLAWKHGRPEVIYSISIGEKGRLHQSSSGAISKSWYPKIYPFPVPPHEWHWKSVLLLIGFLSDPVWLHLPSTHQSPPE